MEHYDDDDEAQLGAIHQMTGVIMAPLFNILSLYAEYRVERALSPGAESGQEVSSTKSRKSKKKISNYIEATVSKEIVKDFFHSTKGQVESIHSLLRAKTTLSFLFLF